MARKRIQQTVPKEKEVIKYKNQNIRSLNAARQGRLDDLDETYSINLDLTSSIYTIRNRSRALAQNDPHITKALQLWRNNIIGNTGIDLHVQSTKQNGRLDDNPNKMIELAWKDWGKYGISTTDGCMSFVELNKLIIESVARDGEFFAIKKFGSQFGPAGFQLDLIPIECLSHAYNGYTSNGNVIFQSVEFDRNLRPVAYWLSSQLKNPMATLSNAIPTAPSIRIPADQCYHLFERHYVGQVRGFPWIVSAILALHHLNAYRISELEMARVASLKQLYFTIPVGEGGISQEDIDAIGQINTNLTPGGADILPMGATPTVVDFNSPNSNMPDFIKAQLKAAASGLCMSYSAIANDLESINFSSAKYSFLEDQTMFKNKQQWFIDNFLDRVYRDWLKYQLDTNRIPLPANKYSKYCSVKWTPRGFASVNLVETAKSAIMLYQLGIASLSQLSAELLGVDFDETIKSIAEENEKMETLGIKLPVMADILKLEALTQQQENQQNK